MVLVTIAAGSFVLGLFIGHLIARRGKTFRLEWRLQVSATEGPDTEGGDNESAS